MGLLPVLKVIAFLVRLEEAIAMKDEEIFGKTKIIVRSCKKDAQMKKLEENYEGENWLFIGELSDNEAKVD